MYANLAEATPFASTIGGYITSIAAPIIVLILGGMWRAAMSRLSAQDKQLRQTNDGLTRTNQALAVLLSEHGQVMNTTATNVTRLSTLETATAVLGSRLDDHVRDAVWKQEAGLTEQRMKGISDAVRDQASGR